MKNNLLKFFIFTFLILTNINVLAQASGGFEDTPEPPDPSTPIDSKLIFLAFAGIISAYYYLNAKKAKAIN